MNRQSTTKTVPLKNTIVKSKEVSPEDVLQCSRVIYMYSKGEQSSEFYETIFELEGVRNEENGAFLEQNITILRLFQKLLSPVRQKY